MTIQFMLCTVGIVRERLASLYAQAARHAQGEAGVQVKGVGFVAEILKDVEERADHSTGNAWSQLAAIVVDGEAAAVEKKETAVGSAVGRFLLTVRRRLCKVARIAHEWELSVHDSNPPVATVLRQLRQGSLAVLWRSAHKGSGRDGDAHAAVALADEEVRFVFHEAFAGDSTRAQSELMAAAKQEFASTHEQHLVDQASTLLNNRIRSRSGSMSTTSSVPQSPSVRPHHSAPSFPSTTTSTTTASTTTTAASDATAAAVLQPTDTAMDDDLQTISHAFVTLVMNGDSYVCAAATLAYSLLQHKTKAALVCMVTPDVSIAAREALQYVFDHVIEVPYLRARAIRKTSKRFQERFYASWIDGCFTKFNVLRSRLGAAAGVRFTTVCLCDADMICKSNPDAIFDVRTPAGQCSVVAPDDDARMHGQALPEELVEQSLSDYGIRGAVMLLQPSDAAFAEVSRLLAPGEYGDPLRYLGPDELLATRLWQRHWHHLHRRFGCIAWKQDKCDEPVALVHYVSEKPWKCEQDFKDFRDWDALARQLLTDDGRGGPVLRDFFPVKYWPRKRTFHAAGLDGGAGGGGVAGMGDDSSSSDEE